MTATPTALWLTATPGLSDEDAWEAVADQIAAIDPEITPDVQVASEPETYDVAEKLALEWGSTAGEVAEKVWLVQPVHRPRAILGTKDRTFTVNLDHSDPIEDPLSLAIEHLGDLGDDSRVTEVEIIEDKVRHKSESAATAGKSQTVYTVQRLVEVHPDDPDQSVRYEPVLDAEGKPFQDVAQAKARTKAVELSAGPELGNLLVVTANVQRDTGSIALVEIRTTFGTRKVKLKATIAKLGPGTDGIVGWMVGLAHT